MNRRPTLLNVSPCLNCSELCNNGTRTPHIRQRVKSEWTTSGSLAAVANRLTAHRSRRVASDSCGNVKSVRIAVLGQTSSLRRSCLSLLSYVRLCTVMSSVAHHSEYWITYGHYSVYISPVHITVVHHNVVCFVPNSRVYQHRSTHTTYKKLDRTLHDRVHTRPTKSWTAHYMIEYTHALQKAGPHTT
ncbi:hypothetical protein J6590_061440 [Homalodisca vitripennis]|nr:hypothetical protein J6590_061440 [Homalodisca vitripennis]